MKSHSAQITSKICFPSIVALNQTPDESSTLSRRDENWALGSRFQFEGLQGLKVQTIAENQQDYGVVDTLLMKLAYGQREMAPKLKESDAWAFALCRRSDKKRTVWGKLVAEDNGAGYDWEDVNIDCKI